MAQPIKIRQDLIRELPDDILCLIVSKLEERDAVKTTVLSKRWFHILSSLNEYKFDQWRMFPPREGEDPCAPSRTDKYLKGVTQFLDFYQPSHIHRFDCMFCLRGVHADDTIDGWLRSVLKRGPESLRCLFYCSPFCFADGSEANLEANGSYVLRSALLNGAKNRLKELCLCRCCLELGSNFSDQFRQLRLLHLRSVTLLEQDLQCMLSCLIKLDFLSLHDCSVPEELYLTSSISLTTLDIRRCSPRLRKIKIHDANLLCLFHCSTEKVVTINSSTGFLINLRRLCYTVDPQGNHSIFASLPEKLPRLIFLRIEIKSDIRWASLLLLKKSTPFPHVTKLKLHFEGNVEFSFSVLKAFPHLKTLIIEQDCRGDFDPVHASTIERFFMRQGCEYCHKSSAWDEGEQQRILKELQGSVQKNVC